MNDGIKRFTGNPRGFIRIRSLENIIIFEHDAFFVGEKFGYARRISGKIEKGGYFIIVKIVEKERE